MRKLLSFPLVLGLILAPAGSVSAQSTRGTAGADLADPDASTVGSVGRIITTSSPVFIRPRLSLLSRPGAEIENEPGARIRLDVPFRRAAGGDGGIGGVIDWIIGLSGPAFIGPRLSVFHELGSRVANERGPRIRVAAAYRWAVRKDGKVDPVSTSIAMQTLQLGIELPIVGLPLSVEPAFALHRFTSDAFDNFTTWSIPLALQLRATNGWDAGRVTVFPLISGSIHYFPSFDTGDFQPVDVTVSRDAPEAVFEILAGFDIRIW
jgi:hypothetical protein